MPLKNYLLIARGQPMKSGGSLKDYLARKTTTALGMCHGISSMPVYGLKAFEHRPNDFLKIL